MSISLPLESVSDVLAVSFHLMVPVSTRLKELDYLRIFPDKAVLNSIRRLNLIEFSLSVNWVSIHVGLK